MVKLFFADPRVDPSSRDNEAIRESSSNGHFTVVKLLLADPRVDPTAKYNEAISSACTNGKFDVVNLLLADPRVYPSTDYNDVIRWLSYDKEVKSHKVNRSLLANIMDRNRLIIYGRY